MFEETEQQNPAVLAGYLQKNKGEGKKKNTVCLEVHILA